MSTKLHGFGAHVCDVCARESTWGCGHTGSQEYAARKHRERRCRCYGHDNCRPEGCKLAGLVISGYMPFYQHTEKTT